MSESFARPKYVGTALPTGATTETLFSTVAAFPGKGYPAMCGVKRLVIDIKHSHAGTMKAYRSKDRGVNWDQIYDSGSIAAPAATSSTIRDFAIEQYDDWKLDWLNGGTNQTTFNVDMALADERAPLI